MAELPEAIPLLTKVLVHPTDKGLAEKRCVPAGILVEVAPYASKGTAYGILTDGSVILVVLEGLE